MIRVPIKLCFTPMSAIMFMPTEENLIEEIVNAIDTELDTDYWNKIFENIDVTNKETIIKWFLNTDAHHIVRNGTVDVESLCYDHMENDKFIVYTVKMLFDEEDIFLEDIL